MAKLKPDAITRDDLIEYLDSTSDFAFELRCLKQLKELGFHCEHGGTYTDPVTGKAREFDIRGEWRRQHICVSIAAECKNVRENFPVLVTTVPRAQSEAFHELLFSFPPTSSGRRWRPITVFAPVSDYTVDAPVGKSSAQVGRQVLNRDAIIVANDAELFSRWDQCLASAADLVKDASTTGPMLKEHLFTLILPIILVPTDRLWQVSYDRDGNRVSDPEQCDRVSIFVGRTYDVAGNYQNLPVTISHFEIVTERGLAPFLNEVRCWRGKWFPEGISRLAPMDMQSDIR